MYHRKTKSLKQWQVQETIKELICFPLPVLSAVVDNMEEFQTGSDVHTI
jgi:hypothetical protein